MQIHKLGLFVETRLFILQKWYLQLGRAFDLESVSMDGIF